MVMSAEAALALMFKLHEEGLTNEEIAKRLRDRGYVSERHGKPIEGPGVAYHIRTKYAKGSVKVVPVTGDRPVRKIKSNERLKMLVQLALSTDLTDEEKDAATALLIKGGDK